MPELHRNPPAHAATCDTWAPTADEMERMYRALDHDATHELEGPQQREYAREYAICIACANGYHDAPGPHADCDCPCHQPNPAATAYLDNRAFFRAADARRASAKPAMRRAA